MYIQIVLSIKRNKIKLYNLKKNTRQNIFLILAL